MVENRMKLRGLGCGLFVLMVDVNEVLVVNLLEEGVCCLDMMVFIEKIVLNFD